MKWLAAAVTVVLVVSPAVARAQEEESAQQPDSQWAAEPPPPVPRGEQPSEQAQPQPAQAPTLKDFQAAPNPYGRWIEIPGLGLVWQPSASVVGSDFTPYETGGSWVTSPQGWTFQSQWSWGWAPFHYGRWYRSPQAGWVWWPNYNWAPAWVDWRYSGGYVAWAPLAPPGFGLEFALGVPGWCYVPYSDFGRPWISRYVMRPRWGVARGSWGEHHGWGWSRTPEWRGNYRGHPQWGTNRTPMFRGTPYGGGNWHAATPVPSAGSWGHHGNGGHGGGGRGGGHGGHR